ncbi:nuclear transport factor 2 family protein [Streptomyces sp. NPDC006798]|uniref:nuclear transport factor 2 family protein n=1 Tax=Streptomyces sp. NPDC006798 TaxID=3155462 RepID=UPI0033ED58EE
MTTDATATTTAAGTTEAPEPAGTAATRAVLDAFLARLGDGSPEALAELYAEEVDWYIAPNPRVPWIKPRSTRADVADHYRELAEGRELDPERTGFDAVVITGEDAVVVGSFAGTVRRTGKAFQSPFALHFTVRDGLIVRFRVIEDSLAIAAACAEDPAPES